MIAERHKTIVLAAAGIPLLLASLYPVVRRMDLLNQQVQPERDTLNVSSPQLIKKMSLGYDALLADLYWTRAVQYYGTKRHRQDPNLRLLYPLLDITVTLDPHLLVAYKFGAIFLAEPPPKGAGQPDQAVALIRRAIIAFPDDWRLWADLGLIYYQDLKDYKKASEAYLEGSKNPQARDWMKIMAAHIAQQGRTRDTSRFLWQQVFTSTQDPSIRRNAREHLMGLNAEEDAEHLAPFVEKFQKQNGRNPASMIDLVRAGLLKGVPLDPAGFPYQISADGQVVLDARSPVASPILKKAPALGRSI